MNASKTVFSTSTILGLSAFFFSAALLTGCQKNDSATPGDGQVTELSGHFAGTYSGTCVVETATRKYTACATQVIIKERAQGIAIQTQVLMTRSNNRNSRNARFTIPTRIDLLKVDGQNLLLNKKRVGKFNDAGFEYDRDDGDYNFNRFAPGQYTYEGTFEDASGQSVQVTGRVKRTK